MKVGFFGGGDQALDVLNLLATLNEFKLTFIHPRNADDPDLTMFAAKHEIPMVSARQVNSNASISFIKKCCPDVLLSINAKQIFIEPLLAVPTKGAINVHNGLLPLQRGGGGAYIGMINGEVCGTTVHFIDPGIDTGEIILQKRYDVPRGSTMQELMDRISIDMPLMVMTALRQIDHDCTWKWSQKNEPYYYVPAKPEWAELIDWNLTSTEVHDRFHARIPGPTCFYIFDDVRHDVLALSIEERFVPHHNTPGQVIERSSNRGVLVKTADTAVWVERINIEGQNNMCPNHKPGSMLVYNLHKEMFDLKNRVKKLESRY